MGGADEVKFDVFLKGRRSQRIKGTLIKCKRRYIIKVSRNLGKQFKASSAQEIEFTNIKSTKSTLESGDGNVQGKTYFVWTVKPTTRTCGSERSYTLYCAEDVTGAGQMRRRLASISRTPLGDLAAEIEQ